MRSFWMVALMILPACSKLPDTSTGPAASSPPVATASASASEAPADLGPGLARGPFTPGRFAAAIQRTNHAQHALQVLREDGTSSFVLSLEADGSATVWRGWRYFSFNDGPQVHTEERIREQLGYRGRWARREGWIHLDVTLDESVCPRIGQYSHLVPDHASEWHLRCLPVVPSGHPLLDAPALACRSTGQEAVFGEDEPHLVSGVLPGRWILLGAGNGLRVHVEAHSVSGAEAPVVRVERSPEPVPTDAWERSF